MTSMAVCLEIEECRLSRLVAPNDRVLRCCMECTYVADAQLVSKENSKNSTDAKVYRSQDERLVPGSCLLIPNFNNIIKLALKLFYFDEELKKCVIIGKCSWDDASVILRRLVNPGSSIDVSTVVMSRSTNSAKVGKVDCRFSLQLDSHATSSINAPLSKKKHEHMGGTMLTATVGQPQPFPYFEFKPLTKKIDWSSVHRNIDIDDLLDDSDQHDINEMFVHGKHLSVGSTTSGRGDEGINKVFQLQQMQLQYIQYSVDTLRSKENTINTAMRSFSLEEQSLDISISKLKARARMLQKSCRSLDRLHEKYESLFSEEAKEFLQRTQAKISKEKLNDLEDMEAVDADLMESMKSINDDAVYTIEEYNRLHPKSPYIDPVPRVISKTTTTDTDVEKKKGNLQKWENATTNKITQDKPLAFDSDSSESEDLQHLLEERKSAPSSPNKPTLNQRQSQGEGEAKANKSPVSSTDTDIDTDIDTDSDKKNDDVLDVSNVSDAELPIHLSWMPPKHGGSVDPKIKTMAAAPESGGWKTASVRSSLGSTAMSQDSLVPLSRPQTAQTAMSVDSLAVVKENKEENSNSSPESVQHMTKATIEKQQPGNLKAGSRPKIQPYFPQDWSVDHNYSNFDKSESFTRGGDGDGDDPFLDDSMVNANVTVTKDQSQTMHETLKAQVSDKEKHADADPWQDVSVMRSQDEGDSYVERSPEQIKSLYNAKATPVSKGQEKYSEGGLDDFEDSAFDVSIDNDEDKSPGLPEKYHYNNNDNGATAPRDLQNSLENSNEIAVSYHSTSADCTNQGGGLQDISHISSPTVKGNSRTNDDSDDRLFSSTGKKLEAKLSENKNFNLAFNDANNSRDSNKNSALHISYNDDDTIADEKPYAPSIMLSEVNTSTDGVGYQRGSQSSAFGQFKPPLTSSTGVATSQDYGNSSFYEQSIDDYLGASGNNDPISDYGDGVRGTGTGTRTMMPSKSSPFHSQNSLNNSFSQIPNPNGSFDNFSDPYSRHQTSPTMVVAVADNSIGFKDESKSESKTNNGPVSYGGKRSTINEYKTTTATATASDSNKSWADAKSSAKHLDTASPIAVKTYGNGLRRDGAKNVSQYEDDWETGEVSHEDGVLLGTMGISPRSNFSSTGNLSSSGKGKDDSTGDFNINNHMQSAIQNKGGGDNGMYNSVDHLKGLLGTSMDMGGGVEDDHGGYSHNHTQGASIGGSGSISKRNSYNSLREEDFNNNNSIWGRGRADIASIEDGSAFDIHISAVKFNHDIIKNRSINWNCNSIQLQFNFLSELSNKSNSIDIQQQKSSIIIPTQYSAHLEISDGNGIGIDNMKLREEIENEEEAISITAFVKDSSTGENIGQANINIWMMIEDSTNIFRHEIDVYSYSLNEGKGEGVVIGSLVVDVRGYRMLLNNYT
jgi:hypothetical protein